MEPFFSGMQMLDIPITTSVKSTLILTLGLLVVLILVLLWASLFSISTSKILSSSPEKKLDPGIFSFS